MSRMECHDQEGDALFDMDVPSEPSFGSDLLLHLLCIEIVCGNVSGIDLFPADLG